MVTVICYDAWSCPKSYLVIRKQPLRQEGFLFISLMTLDSLPHVLSPTSLRQQHNEVACLLQLQNLRWHCRRQIVLKWAIPHFNWDTKLVRKYLTLKSSPIRRPRIWEFNWQWSITSVSWLVCAKSCSFCLFFFFSVCVFLHIISRLCLCSRTCWTSTIRWTLMQQNIIWETRWGLSAVRRSKGWNI